jgi:hypothetical protein
VSRPATLVAVGAAALLVAAGLVAYLFGSRTPPPTIDVTGSATRADASPATSTSAIDVLESGASAGADRRRAALDLLEGRGPASDLPVVATDPSTSFDPSLRDRLAPTVYRTVQGPTPTLPTYPLPPSPSPCDCKPDAPCPCRRPPLDLGY